MVQQETQYYKSVPVIEPPKESGKYMALEVNHGPAEWRELRYDKFNDSWFDGADCFHPTHYLRPIRLPDAALLRSALEKILACRTSCEICQDIAREALSQTGDGWIRVQEKQPQFGEMVWVYDPDVIFPNQYMATWNPCKDDSLPGYFSVGALQGQECWYVTHWRPLPSPPQPINP